MSKNGWREEVAILLERCAESLRAHKYHRGAADLGAALVYLQRAEDEGEKGATTLLAQVGDVPSRDRTNRFTFAAGELEQLKERKP